MLLNRSFRTRRIFASLSFLFLWAIGASAIETPQPLCAEVLSNGDVVISWQAPDDPDGEFFSYLLYVLNPAGDPVLINEITNYATTSFTHLAADADTFSRTYFLQLKSGAGGEIVSESSPPIHTMLLEVTAGGANAFAFLSWNPVFDTIPAATSTALYEIYRENAPGDWVLVGTKPFGEEFYVDTVQGLCYDPPQNINYRVQLADSSGCSSVSGIDGDLLTDATGPRPPEIETVTVDTVTGNVIIYWYPSPEEDTDGYFVQDNTDPDLYINVGHIEDPAIAEFMDAGAPTSPQRYLVIAYDSCGNDESFNIAHETMYLEAQLRECDKEVDMTWTPYIGWEEGILMYAVQASENGGAYEIIQTNSPGNRELTMSVNPFSEYCFRIVAYSVGDQRPSITNTVCIEITYPQTPEYVYLNRVDVIADNLIEVNMLPDNNAFEMDYRLERKSETDNAFQELGIILPGSDGLYSYLDTDVFTQDRKYQYRIAAFDFCQNFHSYSNVSGNVLLRATENSGDPESDADQDYLSMLQWNQYSSWNGGVSEYQVFRALGRDGEYEPLTTISGTYYEDDVFDLIDTHGEFCYYIVARENFNEFGRADTVRSNISCAVQKPLLWIPNAFMVGGYNDIFMPVAGYLDFDRYQMQIFSRWGKEMFTSNDIKVGWDGSYKGSVAQEGIYIYVITFRAGNGQTIEETGSVMLLNANN